MSAKKTVLKVTTLGRKSTNMQSTDFRYSAGQQYSSGLLIWRLHDVPLQAVTCNFFFEAFIVINHVIRHCICSNVPCLYRLGYVCHVQIYVMSPTFWYEFHQIGNIKLTLCYIFLCVSWRSFPEFSESKLWEHPHGSAYSDLRLSS